MTEFEIDGVLTVPEGTTKDQIFEALVAFVEDNGWTFGGQIKDIESPDLDLTQ